MNVRIATFSFLILMIVSSALLAQNEKINETDSKGLKQGVWEKTYDGTDTVRYRGQFKDDKPVGKFEYFDQKGRLQSVIVHKGNGKSKCTMYNTEGGVLAKGNYIGKMKDSTWVYINEYGNKISEEHYVDGTAYGNWRVFYNNGQVMEEKYFENNFENGPFKQYYPSGMVSRESRYINGKLEGDATFYHENGMIRFEGKYKGDAKQGNWKTYDDKGDLIDERMYHKGVPEARDSDLEVRDSSEYIIKDKLTPEDFFEEEDYNAIPEKGKKSKEKKKKK